MQFCNLFTDRGFFQDSPMPFFVSLFLYLPFHFKSFPSIHATYLSPDKVFEPLAGQQMTVKAVYNALHPIILWVPTKVATLVSSAWLRLWTKRNSKGIPRTLSLTHSPWIAQVYLYVRDVRLGHSCNDPKASTGSCSLLLVSTGSFRVARSPIYSMTSLGRPCCYRLSIRKNSEGWPTGCWSNISQMLSTLSATKAQSTRQSLKHLSRTTL